MGLATGINLIDALVGGSWSATPGTAVKISFSFMTAPPAGASSSDTFGFAPMDLLQQAAVRAALAQWAAVANISFTEVAQGGDIQFGTNDQSASQSAGYAGTPDPAARHSISVYLSNQVAYNRVFTPGSYGTTEILHEIGTALGLKLPGNDDSSARAPFLPAATDNGDYTLMSYKDGHAWALTGLTDSTPMLYDIQAIQYLYGTNTSYHTGADTYAFSNASAPQCIWDAGGLNTFDFSACSGGSTIDLNAGAFSSTTLDLRNVSIAYGVTINAAIGSGFADTITANGAGDTISAGSGNDIIYAGAGNDKIDGGAGSDTVVVAGLAANFTLNTSAGGFTVSAVPGTGAGGGVDTLISVESVRFSDKTLSIALDSSDIAGQTYRLYQAAFGRTPDLGGLGYWISMRNHGNKLSDVASQFVNAPEFTNQYGSKLSSAQFVTLLYQHVLHREPDAAGLQYHVDLLDGSNAAGYNSAHTVIDRSQVLISFSESAEYVASTAALIGTGIAYVPWQS